MAWPIIASTMTTLAVFLPLLFWPGVAGQFMFYLPATVIITLLKSLVMALLFVPIIGSLLKGDALVTEASINAANSRSEERRVGKECRSRGGPDHENRSIEGEAV